MKDKPVNPCIGCDVSQCRHHCGSSQNCSLNQIMVSKQNSTVNTKKETICGNFECRSNGHEC